MAEKFPNLQREMYIQVQETQRVQIKINLKRPTLRYITIKMTKVKDKGRIFGAAKKYN